MPLRLPGGNGPGLHPAGETFVEPDIVPPGHRYQIAEPLVRDLVRNDYANSFLLIDRRVIFIDQHLDLAIGDEAGVLHGSRGKVRKGNVVQFPERIWNAEVAIEIAD